MASDLEASLEAELLLLDDNYYGKELNIILKHNTVRMITTKVS